MDPDKFKVLDVCVGRALEGHHEKLNVAQIDNLVDLYITPDARWGPRVFDIVLARASRFT